MLGSLVEILPSVFLSLAKNEALVRDGDSVDNDEAVDMVGFGGGSASIIAAIRCCRLSIPASRKKLRAQPQSKTLHHSL